MVRSSWKRVVLASDTPRAEGARRRSLPRLIAACETLDNRQLLSTVAATSAVLPGPTATALASAAATLNALNPTAFAQFQTDLAGAESQSRVTPADARKLARDEKIIDQTIKSYSPDAATTSNLLNQVQTDVDNAFLENTVPAFSWAQEQQGLSQLLAQSLQNVHISTFVIRDTIDRMKVVARAAGNTSQLNEAVVGNWAAISNDVGSTLESNLGTGSADLDPIEVYYEGQVNQFIK